MDSVLSLNRTSTVPIRDATRNRRDPKTPVSNWELPFHKEDGAKALASRRLDVRIIVLLDPEAERQRACRNDPHRDQNRRQETGYKSPPRRAGKPQRVNAVSRRRPYRYGDSNPGFRTENPAS